MERERLIVLGWRRQADEYWNHNVHYQRVILDAVPDGCGAAVDVGCGDGLLARKLAGRCAAVTGIDRDEPIIDRSPGNAPARSRRPALSRAISLRTRSTTPASTSPAPTRRCITWTSARPWSRWPASCGLAAGSRSSGSRRNGSPADWVIGAAGIPANLYYKRTRGEGNPGAPIMDPDMSWSQVREAAARLLPGARYRRHLLWRYSLRWTKPG